jgi:hypothetical protein
MTLTHSAPAPIPDRPLTHAPHAAWWQWLMPRTLRQFQWRSLVSPFWWLRTWHPWSGFALIVLWWIWQNDRRPAHQIRLQRLFFQRVNFRDIELMLSDFVRPELWFM